MELMRYFEGEINGKKLSSFNPSALENLEKYSDRLQLIEDLIINDESSRGFFEGYMEKYYKVSPNMDDKLSEEDAVCNMLALFATYLLSSKDIESERKVEYKFWKSIRDFKKSEEFKSTINESQLSNGDSDNRTEVIDMFVDKNKKNSKKPKDIKVTTKDIKNNKYIGALQDAIKFVNSEVGESKIKSHIESVIESVDNDREKAILKRVLGNYKSYMKKYIASMKDDQLIIKKSTDVVLDFDVTMDDGGFPMDWSVIDLSNRKVFVELLENLNQRELMAENDIQLVTYDLYQFLTSKSLGLSERELQVVKLFGSGLEQKKIADKLGVTKSSMQVYVNRIHAKVVKSGYTIE